MDEVITNRSSRRCRYKPGIWYAEFGAPDVDEHCDTRLPPYLEPPAPTQEKRSSH